MNRHDSYQQPEATADNANAKQWQVDLSERDAGKVGNDSDAGGVNGGKNANDINHISDQGETVEVRVIKDDRDEPNDRPGQVEQGGQAGQAVQTDADESQYSTNVGPEERSGRAVQTDAEAQPRKRRIIELLGSSPLGVMAQTAFDSVRHSVHEIQVDRQIKLIDKTLSPYNDGTEAPEEYSRLNQLVDEDKIKLSDNRVLKKYLERINRANDGRVVGNNTEFIKRLIQEDKIDLSKSEVREEYLKVALSSCWNSKRFGVQEAVDAGKLDLSNEKVTDQFLNVVGEEAAFNAYGIDLLKDSGVSPEKIVDNEHIQQLAIKRMGNIASKTHKDSGFMDGSEYKIFGNTYLADVLDKVCSDEEGRRRLKESIDTTGASVQELGESSEMTAFDTLKKWSDNQIVNIAKYNNILRKLGWQPSGDALLEKMSRLDGVRRDNMLHGNDPDNESVLMQDKAQELGLITPDVVDKLYTDTYRKLLNIAKKGEDFNRKSGYVISPNLLPSGNDPVANYWHEQSKYLGADAMKFCVGRVSKAVNQGASYGGISDTTELISDDGFLKDAFFRNRPGSLLSDIYTKREHDIYDDAERCIRTVEFLEAHRDQASEIDGSRAMIDLLGKMKDKDGRYDAGVIATLRIFVGSPDKYRELFGTDNNLTTKLYDKMLLPGYTKDTEYYDEIDKMVSSYIDSNWKDHYSDAEKSYLNFVFREDRRVVDMVLGNCFDSTYNTTRTKKDIATYFDADGPTHELQSKMLFCNIDFLYQYPDLQTRLSENEKGLVEFCQKYELNKSFVKRHGLIPDNLADYFDANGPKSKFWQDTFLSDTHNLDLIYKYYQNQDEAGRERMGLDDKQIAVAKDYSSISEGNDWNDPRKLFESYVKEHYDELTIDQIGWTASIIARLANSNASELIERSEAFTRELLKLDADKIPEALDKIEDIYIHNHLPYVGKNYLVFRTMHPSPNLEDDFDFDFDNGQISPVLQQATGDIRSGKLDQMLNSRDTIIVSDLLRASLGSNNRSIREYLTTLKNGQALLDQLSSGELDWSVFSQPTNLMNKDTKANYDTLSTFAWHLATIYNSTLSGKERPYQLIHQQSGTDELSAQPNALQTDFTNLTSLIKPNSRYSLADRAVRYFAHFVGIEDLAGAERYMDNVVKEADTRNRKTAEYLATTKEPKLQLGDLVKGMGGTDGYGIRYLSYAFQNGSISKEYLGDASRSDTTPLDADASIVLDDEQAINQTMASMLANGYGGGLWVVLRPDKDRFIITRRDKHEADQSVYDLSVPDVNFDRTNLTREEIDRRLKEIAEAKRHRREGLPKLEIFATGVDGDGHYGVRTGFGMNLVSFCVTDSTLRDFTPVSEVTKLEIALNGFYIPIIDRDSEELIFTPDDYDKMRAQMSGLSHYRTGDYQFAPDSELELPSTDVKETVIPSTSTIISELPASMAETDHKHEVINQVIKQAITSIPELNLSYKDYLDGDLTENIVEMIDTGSTGRQTNAPGSGDFDYLARLDRSILNDPTKKQQITDALLAAFGKADEVNGMGNQIDNLDHNEEEEGEGEASQADNKSRIVNGNLRLKQVSIDGLAEPVDIDITFTQKTNKVQYPTDAALADRLNNIKNQSETKYQQVLANIIYAKQFLKAAGAYKPRRSPEAKGIGGLGGVGIENWVLQHGGSFKQAARDFLSVADNCSSFEDFCAHYPVWDYGENHKGIRSKPHDNFVADNMNPEGYERMKEALRVVVN